MYKLVISTEADQDLDAIYEEGYIKRGEVQADKYNEAILYHFGVFCDNPYLYRAVDEIRDGYCRSVCGKHSVFYRVVGDAVEIMGLIKYENRFFESN